MKINKQIEIVRASNSKYSSMSLAPSKVILNILSRKYSSVIVTEISSLGDLKKLVLRRPDLVFLTVKQIPVSIADESRMVWVSDVLSDSGINHTGSLSEAISLDYDKTKAKDKVSDAGLRTADYFIARPGDYSEESLPIPFPLFIKPTSMGNKKGVDAESVVHNYSDYVSKVQSLETNFSSSSLVEPFLTGREFSVAVLENHGTKSLSSMPVEIVIGANGNGDRILGTTADSGDDEVVTIVRNQKLYRSLQALAEGVFRALDARDYGRIDIRLNGVGEPQFLEANLIPGLSTSSFYPIANKIYNNLNYDETILQIVSIAFERPITVNN
jgi:D-alanine-D-alanine ligase